jgi:hypothetical protein
MNAETLGLFLAGFGIIAGFMYWMFFHLDADIKAISSKIDTDMKAQTERTDRLYNIIIDLLKEKKV